MAYEISNYAVKITLPAAADLSAKQYYFVKVNSSGQAALCAAATDKPIGVLQNAPAAAGDAAEILVIGGTKLVTNGACDEGDLVGTASTGKGAPYVAGTDTTKYIVGSVILASGADAEIATVIINCASTSRGA